MSDEPSSYTVSAVRRRRQRKPPPRINGPEDIYRAVAPVVRDADREHFFSILLSTKNHVLAVELVSVGSLSSSLVHPREVLKPALLRSAAALVVVHNHPSGDVEPSNEDVEFTQRLQKACEILGIRFLDHVIVANGDFTSLKARGVL